MAKDPLGHEGRASEKGKWQQDEACQRDQFELDDRDEDLDRQDEESDHDNQPGNEQDQDLYKVGEEANRSEEHTSELQSLMRTSYAVFCLKKQKKQTKTS